VGSLVRKLRAKIAHEDDGAELPSRVEVRLRAINRASTDLRTTNILRI
jgi:hypothetical protein